MEKQIEEGKGKNIYIDDMFFSIFAMEKLIKQDNVLGQKFKEAMSKEDLYGYHKNENIVNELFRLYVLPKNINPASLDYEDVMMADKAGELEKGDNYERFNAYKVIRAKLEKFKNSKKGKGKVEETTTAAAGAAGYAIDTKNFVSKDKNKGKVAKGKVGGVPWTIPADSNDSLDNQPGQSFGESVEGENTIKEQQLPMVTNSKLNSLKKDNEKNFKTEFANNSEILNKAATKDNDKEQVVQKVKADDKEMDPEEVIPQNKREEQEEFLSGTPRGIEDMLPDNPAKAYIDRIKQQIKMGGAVGDKIVADMEKKQKTKEDMPRYAKEPQPVYMVKESVDASYENSYGERKFTNFQLANVEYVDKLDESYVELTTEGLNDLSNPERKEILENVHFFLKEGKVYGCDQKVISENKEAINEGVSEIKRLLNYKPQRFSKGKKQ